MNANNIVPEAVRSAKWNLYGIFLLNGVFIQFFAPFQYKCNNITENECFACGLRTAVTLLLQGRFSEAYQSNKLIVGIVIIGIVMAADVLHYLYQRQKAKRYKPIQP